MYITDKIPQLAHSQGSHVGSATDVSSRAGSYSWRRGLAASSEGEQELAVSEVTPLDLKETTREGLLDGDLTVRIAKRCSGDTFTVTPDNVPRDKEGQQ